MNEQVYSNAIMYLRVSTKEQAQKGGESEGYSIPAQRAACIRKAEGLGAKIVDEFVDAGESAKTSARPQLQAMLRRLEEGGIQYVIVHKIDRLARNRLDDVTITLAIKKAGARLVSVSENIDETPSGHLMHGIMSSIAEFYSQNLANEVMKGMTQKARKGGTLGKAPIGYINMPKVFNNARVSTVQVDEQRAPLVQWAFQAYATGNYSLNSLTDMLAAKGLLKPAYKNKPASPLGRSHVHRMLQNKYYIGKTSWNGVENNGAHTPLVSYDTFQHVQDILAGHRLASDRQREHNHYLRGSIWCRECNSRLCFSQTTNRHNVAYDYFFCVGRKLRHDCSISYLSADLIEEKVVNEWQYIAIDPKYLSVLRAVILEELKQIYSETKQLENGAEDQRNRIMKEQQKLLEAHYADAIPLQLLKKEQERLAIELDNVERVLVNNRLVVENVEKNLDKCLELVKDCFNAYKLSKPNGRRLMNQAMFKQILIDREGIDIELAEHVGLLLSPNILQPLDQKENPKEQDASSDFMFKKYQWSDGIPRWLQSSGWWDKLQGLDLEKEKSNLRASFEKIGLGWNKKHLVRVTGL